MTDRRGVSIKGAPLPTQAARVLRDAGIETLGDLCGYTASELVAMKNFGGAYLAEVCSLLEDVGLGLAEDDRRLTREEWVAHVRDLPLGAPEDGKDA